MPPPFHLFSFFFLLLSFIYSDIDAESIDGYYLLACCLSTRKLYEQALHKLTLLFSVNDDAQKEEILRLNSFLCTKMDPPQYDEAIRRYNILVQKFPEDMNSVSNRIPFYFSWLFFAVVFMFFPILLL